MALLNECFKIQVKFEGAENYVDFSTHLTKENSIKDLLDCRKSYPRNTYRIIHIKDLGL